MKVTISVTQKDIDQGKQALCFFCPVALATQRTTDIENCTVGLEKIMISGHRSVPLPLEVRQWIWDYDYARKVEPFSFVIELVPVQIQESSWVTPYYEPGLVVSALPDQE